MKKNISLNIVPVTIVAVIIGLAYCLLTQNKFHTSISSIIGKSSHLGVKHHILVLGLVPIYIAMVIFGATVLSIYLGSTIQQYLVRFVSLYKKKILLRDEA